MADRILYIQTPSLPKTPVGIEDFIVSITEQSGVLSCDKTLTEIQNAAGRGAIIEATTPHGKAKYRTSSTNAEFQVIESGILYTYIRSSSTVSCDTRILGTYDKPSGGIPATDLTSTVQTSLSNADNAIQKTDNAIQYTMNTSTSNGVTTVTINNGAEEILTTCVSQKKVYFVSGTKFFTPTEVNLLTYSVNLICEIDGMCYETTIAPSGASAMTGTLKTYPSGTYPITVTYSNSTYTCDRTYSQIYDASVLSKSMPVTVINGSERTIGWVQYTYSSEVALCYLTSWDTLPILVTLFYDSNGITKTQHDLQLMPETITNSNTSVTLTPSDNQVYNLTASSLSSLTISSETGSYSITFKSGSTATTFTKPNSLIMPDGFTIEANKRYEINVSNHYAVVASWAVSA